MQSQLNFDQFTFRTKANETSVDLFECIPLLDKRGFYKHIDNLSEDQKGFITLLNTWFQSRCHDIIIISGSPGSGKTFTVIKTLKYVNASILKMAYLGRVACNIGGGTIHSVMKLNWGELSPYQNIVLEIENVEKRDDTDYITTCLNISKTIQEYMICVENPDIIVIDEIGMVPFWLTIEIIKYFFSLEDPKLVILLGDEYQLKPVKTSLNIFDINTIDYKHLKFNGNKRFSPEYKNIIDTIKVLIDQNDLNKFVTYIDITFPIIQDVYEDLLKKCNRVLAYRNDSVKKYNDFYIENFPGQKIVLVKPNVRKCTILKKNCEIIITKNCEVPNGTRLIFLEYDSEKDVLICTNLKAKIRVKRDKFDEQFPVTLGFACTIHKFQGETIEDENILIDFDQHIDMNLIYTALSRVRSMNQILGIKK